MDNISKKRRSYVMSLVKSKDTKIETAFRKALWNAGYKYRKNVKSYFGKPDLVLKRYKTAIFIDSCFWHGCKKHCRIPAANRKYWIAKIEGNRKRDSKVNRYYRRNGWQVCRVWEHSLKNLNKVIESTINKLKKGPLGPDPNLHNIN